jgi:hypothetical protein
LANFANHHNNTHKQTTAKQRNDTIFQEISEFFCHEINRHIQTIGIITYAARVQFLLKLPQQFKARRKCLTPMAKQRGKKISK